MSVGLILPLTPDLFTQLTDLPNARGGNQRLSGVRLRRSAVLRHAGVGRLALAGFVVNYFLMAAAPTLF